MIARAVSKSTKFEQHQSVENSCSCLDVRFMLLIMEAVIWLRICGVTEWKLIQTVTRKVSVAPQFFCCNCATKIGAELAVVV